MLLLALIAWKGYKNIDTVSQVQSTEGKMLKALAVGGALASLLVSAAYAHEPHHAKASPDELVYSAIVEVGAGYLWTSTEDGASDSIDDRDFPVIEGAARANIPLASNFSIQFDLDGMVGINERDDSGDDYLQNFFFGGFHVTWRDPSTAAAGILFSYGESNGGDDEEAQVFFFGGEAQGYFDNLTLYGQAGYMVADDASNTDVITDAFWLRGVGRYFLSPNQRLQAEFAYINGEENQGAGADDIDGWAWAGRYDQAINDGPLTIFVSYRGSYIREDESTDDTLTDHTVLVGIALRLGAENLRDEDRRGATLDTPAWAMGRWTGWTLDVVD